MYPVKQYVCLVDTYRRPSRWRNTRGRYRVGAKNEKEARRLLQKAIGFGSVLVYYEDKNCPPQLRCKYRQCAKEKSVNYEGKPYLVPVLVPVVHATAKQEKSE